MAMWDLIKPLKPRGVRFSLPQGFILGRVSPGYGDAELIPLRQVMQEGIKTGLVPPGPVNGGGATIEPPLVGVMINSFAGVNKNGYMPLAVIHKAVTMPAATPADLVTCRVAPTNTINFTIVNDPTAYQADRLSGYLGTVTVLAGHTTGTVTWAVAPTLLARGTVLYLYMDPANGEDTSIAIDTTFTVLEILLTTDLA